MHKFVFFLIHKSLFYLSHDAWRKKVNETKLTNHLLPLHQTHASPKSTKGNS